MQIVELNQNGNRFGASLASANWRDRFVGHRKIAIVAKAPDTIKQAPWNDPAWAKWILNDMVSLGEAPAWDACFEIHGKALSESGRDSAHGQWLRKSHGKPIVNCRHYAEVPDCVPLPVDEITAAMGRYITNTVSWMLATAILLQPEEIGLWGVNMAQDGEYSHQRPSCEYFIGVALGRGIRVTIPNGADIMKAPLMYGVDESPVTDKMRVRRAELDQRLANARVSENHWTTQRIAIEGMIAELRYWHMYYGAAE